ncbi:5-(carboxyamino)imidazole ribonucleotide synthase [Pseudorhodoplanes sp.]|uniref:5-(carboxyamino)imidazole ribonucleotide synthase n=1 Tax=Pseudorhodoplanes sp. TaxID=1934341 RepID=UPI002BFAABEE|nr:5-(carboxyamino)imidazole ribonucleotide synthase [Pseudorhodoplanes sp.]HWV54557.1 5-(carboxyamino)imidazole ribonucleotide synthase [Pseudorhodoplanes sp.]
MIKRDNGSLPPGATIGILGGGQLARMLAQAASRIGLNCHVYAPEADSCAFEVVKRATIAPYEDQDALARFANECDVITYEFENVPAQTASFLSQRKLVLPDPRVLATTQDRLIEKEFVEQLDIATAPYAPVADAPQLFEAVRRIGLPAILKTRRFGYDGKGQFKIDAGGDPAVGWRAIGGAPCILEGFVPFEREVSVVVARGRDGSLQSFDVTENEHRDHILKVSRVPAGIPDQVAAEAVRIAETIATAFDYVGVLAVEMFVVRDGTAQRVLVNEIAPRVHNSGHWTIDGCSVSQFEQHIRAIAGWPLAVPVRLGRVEMVNLIGAEAADYGRWLTVPGASLHLYGKGEPVPGRKMGHVTRVQVD